MESYEPDFDEDGVPWASPEIQRDYEAALGRFMLAFNRLDNLLTELIKTVLTKAGTADLIRQFEVMPFGQRLRTADLLKTSVHGKGLSGIPIEVMREISEHRNNVAHGHFDQNPFSGEYDIVSRKRMTYSAIDLDLQTSKATKAWN